MPASLLRRLAPLLVLLAVVASACGSAESQAATVNGNHITASSLQDELKLIKGNKAYRGALEQSYGAKLAGASKGTFDSAFTAQTLTLRIYYDLIERDLATRKVKLT